MKWIDMRSDTVTQPTEAMRQAIFSAEVGDDVYGDDPTVNKLEALAAEMLGKEAALFVPSGTMGNQLAIMTHTKRGDEIIIGINGHVFAHEVGAAAILSQAFIRTLQPEDDVLTWALIKKAVRPVDIHMPDTGLIVVENPLAMGKVVSLDILEEIYQNASERKIPVHLDGARLFNAATALNVEAKEIVQYADSAMFCLSKGLCAPVGSMLVGTTEFIAKARKNRKLLGGGLRQAGFLAAAGIIALEEMTKRLHEDHDNAKYLAQELAKLPQITVDQSTVEINMVFFKVDAPGELVEALPEKFREKGININGEEDGLMRFVTNNGVTKEDIDYAIQVFTAILSA